MTSPDAYKDATALLKLLWRTEGACFQLAGREEWNRTFSPVGVASAAEGAARAIAADQKTVDCFFSAAEFRTSDSRLPSNATRAYAVWTTVAYGPHRHSPGSATYSNSEAALGAVGVFCRATQIPEPNVIVDGGDGLEVYWITDSFIDKDVWNEYAYRFVSIAKGVDFRIDSHRTALTAALRIPGTTNRDCGPPRPISVIRTTDTPMVWDTLRDAIDRAGARFRGADDGPVAMPPVLQLVAAQAVPSSDAIPEEKEVSGEESTAPDSVGVAHKESPAQVWTASSEIVLSKYSLLGQGKAMSAALPERKPILGGLAYQRQGTVIYADSNVGKTMLTLHLLSQDIKRGLVDPTKLFYLNADDDSHGLAEKLLLSDAHGFHMLSPGHKGFDVLDFKNHIEDMIRTQTASGVIVILDTLKKFAHLMDKTKGQQFTDRMRRFVLAGGGVIGLAHLNKNKSASGESVHSGTTDMVNDLDCVVFLNVVNDKNEDGRRVVAFSNTKRRGNNTSGVAFSYVHDGDLTYEERLSTIREEGTALGAIYDEKIIKAVKAAIGQGIVQKQLLVDHVRQAAGVSKSVVQRVLTDYAGKDPQKAHWEFDVGPHNTHKFRLNKPDTVGDF